MLPAFPTHSLTSRFKCFVHLYFLAIKEHTSNPDKRDIEHFYKEDPLTVGVLFINKS